MSTDSLKNVNGRMSLVSDIDWPNWQPRDPATLVFVIREGRVLLIRKKRGLGMGKVTVRRRSHIDRVGRPQQLVAILGRGDIRQLLAQPRPRRLGRVKDTNDLDFFGGRVFYRGFSGDSGGFFRNFFGSTYIIGFGFDFNFNIASKIVRH